MRFVEDLTQTQIAAAIDISQMHVSRLLRRSLDRLQISADPSPSEPPAPEDTAVA